MKFFSRQPQEELETHERTIRDVSSKKRFARAGARIQSQKEEERLINAPLTKSGRLFIFFILLFFSVSSAILALISRDGKLPGIPRLPLGSVKFEETILLGNSEHKETDKRIDKAKSEWIKRTNLLSGIYAFYIVRLKSGEAFGVSELEQMQAASLIKLPVMAALLKESEEGALLLSTTYTLKDSDKIGGSGSLYYKAAGTVVTYQELLSLMGKQSDNTAFNIVRKRLGDSKITKVIKEFGMSETSLSENLTTPYDIGMFFKNLWNNEVISRSSRDLLLTALTDTSFESWLRKGIPTEIRVSHKYGREIHVVNDAGVVYTKNPFVLVIMTKGIVEKEADQIFPELTSLLYGIEAGSPGF